MRVSHVFFLHLYHEALLQPCHEKAHIALLIYPYLHLGAGVSRLPGI